MDCLNVKHKHNALVGANASYGTNKHTFLSACVFAMCPAHTMLCFPLEVYMTHPINTSLLHVSMPCGQHTQCCAVSSDVALSTERGASHLRARCARCDHTSDGELRSRPLLGRSSFHLRCSTHIGNPP